MDWKRVLAREWLILVACVFGVAVLFLGAVFAFGDPENLTNIDELWILSVPGLALWGLVMFVRSIVWAVKVLRSDA